MKRVIKCNKSPSPDSWRDRKNMVDIEAIDDLVERIVDEADHGETDVYLAKRHYKPNFIRYDIRIGFLWPHQSDQHEVDVIKPLFDRIKKLAADKGINAYYVPSSHTDSGHIFTKYFAQLRIPYDVNLSHVQSQSVNSSKHITAGKRFYFGMEASAQYGDLIAEKLAGKTISKRRDKGEQPGGLVYEAKQLGIDMWDLLEALEGMCYEGRAQEIDDSTYRVKGSVKASTNSQSESIYEVYYIQDGRECVEFEGTEDECNEYIDEVTPDLDDEYGDEYPEMYVRRKTNKSKITSSADVDDDFDLKYHANALFAALKDYGATRIESVYGTNVYKISFSPDQEEADFDLIYNLILSRGFKEIAAFGKDPAVYQFLDEKNNRVVFELQSWKSGEIIGQVSDNTEF